MYRKSAISTQMMNVIILSLCYTIGFSGVPMVFLVGGIVGSELAPSPAWATLPVAVLVVGTALSTIPAAFTMKRVGRKRGFILAAAIASIAALAAASAIAVKSFFLFSASLLFIGGCVAFVMQYRFAAAESVEPRYVGKAVSFVLIGGVLAGYLGPEIGRLARNWLDYGAYSGSFVVLAILYAISVVLLLFLRDITLPHNSITGGERPLRVVVTQPTYLVAVLSGAVAYGVMSFIMAALPISMHVIDRFNLKDTTLVFQSHMMAMYLPSLFTGMIVERLGVKVLQVLGIIGMGACAVIAGLSHDLINYLVALICLGIGWNFLFVGGTVLLTRSYYSTERFKAQAVNDFAVFGTQALAALSGGSVILTANWELLNLLCLPFLLFAMFLVLVSRTTTDVGS